MNSTNDIKHTKNLLVQNCKIVIVKKMAMKMLNSIKKITKKIYKK